jgi:Uma2 family endonuclease
MKATAHVEPMTLDTFIFEFTQTPFEWIGGEKLVWSPSLAGPNFIAKLIFRALLPFEEQGLGEIFTEAVFVLTDESNCIRGCCVPDVMFFSAAWLAVYRRENPDWHNKPYLLIPDFVVEVVAPSDIYSEVNRKIDAYLANGVRLIWVADPQRERITVYDGGQITVLGKGEILTGGQIIPDLKVKLADLFQ